MAKDLLVTLKKALDERRMSIPKLAIALGIPKDRIYKWYQEGTHPKPNDTIKLWSWINGEKAPRETNEDDRGGKITAEAVLLKVLLQEFADYKGKKEGVNPDDIVREIESKASLILKVAGKI